MAKSGPRTKPSASVKTADDVKSRLIEAAIVVLARDGFAHASARTIAAEANGANGLIYYHFGSMDQLLAATARTLAIRGIARVRDELGGPDIGQNWHQNLDRVLRNEAVEDDGQAVLELMVGARTSEVLANEIRTIIDEALDFASSELTPILAGTPLAHLPSKLAAEVAGATFLGLEILVRNGRQVDIDHLAALVAAGLALFTNSQPSSD